MYLRIFCLALFWSTLGFASASGGVIVSYIDPGTDNRIKSITGIEIFGKMYDATYHYEVPFAGLPSDAITFTDPGHADIALLAIGNALNYFSPILERKNQLPARRTEWQYIPYQISSATRVNLATASLRIQPWGSGERYFAKYAPPHGTPPYGRLGFPTRSSPLASHALITFKETAVPSVVPEPTSAVIFCLVSLSPFVRIRRRRR